MRGSPLIFNRARKMKTKEEKTQKNKIYYEVNKERILAMKQAQRDEIKGVVKQKPLTSEEAKEKYRQTRREWYLLNSEKIIARNKAYREANKEKMKVKWDLDNAAKREKKLIDNAQGLKELAEKYAPKRTRAMEVQYTTRTEIAKRLGVKPSYIEGISKKEKYRMPKHKETNGVICLYCRKEIEEWMPFAQDMLAFHRLGEKLPSKRSMYKFKEGSMAHGLITFMQNNVKLHLRNIAVRREQGRIYGF